MQIRTTPYQAIPHYIFWFQIFHFFAEGPPKNPSENPLSNLLYCKSY